MKQLKKIWRLSMGDLFITAGTMLGIGLLGAFGVFFATGFGEELPENYLMLGSMLALMVWILIDLWGGMVTFGKVFELTVSMSRTRKAFFVCHFICNVLNSCVKMLICIGLTLLEKYLASKAGALDVLAPDMSYILLDYRGIIGIIFFTVAIRMLFGVLYLKYQMIVFWVLWGLTMCMSFLGSFLGKIVHAESVSKVLRFVVEVFEWIAEAGGLVQILLIGLVCGVMTAIAGVLTGKQAVKC